jgi:hypothetical protein
LHVISQDVVASPLTIIPSMLMLPKEDVPEQDTLDVKDKFDPQFDIRATPQ